MSSQVSILPCDNYNPDLVLETTRRAIGLIGGITNYIKPESSVLVKPNLLMAADPSSGVVTHHSVVRAVVKILKSINCRIYLGDGPSVWGNQIENIHRVFDKTQMAKIAVEEGIELVKFDKRRWRGNFPLTAWLDNCDYLVSVPKFKTHNLTTLTGAIKNLFGLVPGTYKTELHKRYFDVEDFSKVLVQIYEQARPALTIVDAIEAMEGDGPGTSGRVKKCGLLITGQDCVSIDSILAKIMGLSPEDILTNKEAAERRLGIAKINSIEISGMNLDEIRVKDFKLPSTSVKKKIPRPLIEIAKKFLRFYPKVDHRLCVRCGACIEVCPQKVISEKNNRIQINYSGCISCFCCQETCPHSAMKIKRSLLAKILKL